MVSNILSSLTTLNEDCYASKSTPVRALAFEDSSRRECFAPYSACDLFEFLICSLQLCLNGQKRNAAVYL